jgi:hypothetical protein
MSRLDDLKDAMAAPPDFTAQPVDLGEIMAAGGRIRRRRRLGVTAASGLVVAALLVGGTQLTGTAARPGFELPAGAPGSTSPSPDTSDRNKPAWGKVESIGYGDWVVYAIAIQDAAIPQTAFGVMAGVRKPGGSVQPVVETNESSGSDKSPGFHAIEGSMEVNGKTSPTFGYYVGPAAKITGMSGGQRVTAGRATWSEDPSVQFFWFGTAQRVTKISAFDKSGTKITGGDNSVGVG